MQSLFVILTENNRSFFILVIFITDYLADITVLLLIFCPAHLVHNSGKTHLVHNSGFISMTALVEAL